MRSAVRCPLSVRSLLIAVVLMTLPAVLPAAASADSCPNAVFRSGLSSRLPDCRAYEMVTPPYKEGYPVYVDDLFVSNAAEDGGQVLGTSIGVFGGTEDDLFEDTGVGPTLGADYLFRRGESGWSPIGIDPSAAQYPQGALIGLSSELNESLWAKATVDQSEAARLANAASPAESFYVRSSNGPVLEVGPILPPGVLTTEVAREYASLRGVSSEDLSVVLFAMHEKHWPGDETEPGAESLYEYVGTGNAVPLLVGVSGGAGSSSLISKCGTQLGSAALVESEGLESIDTERHGATLASYRGAVSSSGETVFFTPAICGASPAVAEVFARVDNGQPGAHTVAISEPSKEDCPACDTEAGVQADATFQWASADGSKVFFTTSQPLLGGEGSNNLYEYDFQAPASVEGQSGKIVRVSVGDATVTNPTADVEEVLYVSPDGSHVYFTASGVLTRTRNSLGQEAEAGQSNLYLYERDAEYPNGRTVFIMPHPDLYIEAIHSGASFSQNGWFMAFRSSARLTADDLSSDVQGFEYDSQTGDFVRYSIGQNGFNADGNTGSPSLGKVANDGSVYFDSGNALVPQAVGGQDSVYEYREGAVNLISSGQDTHAGGASLDFISPSGGDVFFQTFERLVPEDTDSQEDTYDARVDGGFPEAPPPPLCEADACQGPLSGAPVLLSPGSEFQAGGENVASSASEAVSKSVPKKKPKARDKSKRKQAAKKRKARKSSRAMRGPHGSGGRR
jgi:hypothetical protein